MGRAGTDAAGPGGTAAWSPVVYCAASPAVRLAEVHAADVPAHDGWLTPAERDVLATLRVAKRRDDWRLGRWAAKRAVARALADGDDELPPHRIEVLAADDGAPEAMVHPVMPMPGRDDRGSRVSVSISHSRGIGLAAAAPGRIALGVDIEAIAPRSDRFIEDYFTSEEAVRVRNAPPADRPLLANLTWAAKEAALKALRTGLRLDTRAVVVEEIGPEDFVIRVPGGEHWRGIWRAAGGMVRTVVLAGNDLCRGSGMRVVTPPGG